MSTEKHREIARFLLLRYPNLALCEYAGNEYLGESILHIAIVNKDFDTVKFLLGRESEYKHLITDEAEYNQSLSSLLLFSSSSPICVCSFIDRSLPETDRSYNSEENIIARKQLLKTRARGEFFTYGRACYYGEYPLFFACSTEQIDLFGLFDFSLLPHSFIQSFHSSIFLLLPPHQIIYWRKEHRFTRLILSAIHCSICSFVFLDSPFAVSFPFIAQSDKLTE